MSRNVIFTNDENTYKRSVFLFWWWRRAKLHFFSPPNDIHFWISPLCFTTRRIPVIIALMGSRNTPQKNGRNEYLKF